MTSFKELQNLLLMSHDQGMIDDEELYIVHMSEKTQIFLTNYILNSTLMKWVKMNGMLNRVQVSQTGHLDSC